MTWQPIETARRDRVRPVLGFDPDYADDARVMYWKDGGEYPGWYLIDVSGQLFPTHWMPLPRPPADTSSGSAEASATK